MKKLLNLALVFVMAVALLPIVTQQIAVAAPNLDTASTWARPEIQSSYDRGIITPELLAGNYQAPIMRGEFVRLAMHYLRVTLNMNNTQLVEHYATHSNRTFTDTNDQNLIAAGKLGITSGTGGTEPNRVFGDGLFDREMAAFMLRRVHLIVNGGSETVSEQGYNDMNQVRWHPGAVNYVIYHRIMTGTNPSAGIFSPLNNFTREQSIATFDRMETDGLLNSNPPIDVGIVGLWVLDRMEMFEATLSEEELTDVFLVGMPYFKFNEDNSVEIGNFLINENSDEDALTGIVEFATYTVSGNSISIVNSEGNRQDLVRDGDIINLRMQDSVMQFKIRFFE